MMRIAWNSLGKYLEYSYFQVPVDPNVVRDFLARIQKVKYLAKILYLNCSNLFNF